MLWTIANPAFVGLLIVYGAVIERVPITLWQAVVLLGLAALIGAWLDGKFERPV